MRRWPFRDDQSQFEANQVGSQAAVWSAAEREMVGSLVSDSVCVGVPTGIPASCAEHKAAGCSGRDGHHRLLHPAWRPPDVRHRAIDAEHFFDETAVAFSSARTLARRSKSCASSLSVHPIAEATVSSPARISIRDRSRISSSLRPTWSSSDRSSLGRSPLGCMRREIAQEVAHLCQYFGHRYGTAEIREVKNRVLPPDKAFAVLEGRSEEGEKHLGWKGHGKKTKPPFSK